MSRTCSRAALSTAAPTGLDGFFRVSVADMTAAEEIFATQSVVQAAFELTVSSLLAGGVLIRHPVLPRGDVDQAWFSDTWGSFLRDLVRALWLYGFCVCAAEPDDAYVAVPRVVPMALLQIELYYSDHGKRTYRVSRLRRAAVSMSDAAPLDAVMGDVVVYELDAPTTAGRLSSKILALQHDAEYTAHISRTYVEAMQRRANVPLVLESLPDSYDSKNIRVAEAEPALGSLEAVTYDPLDGDYQSEQRVAHMARLANAGLDPNLAYGTEVRTTHTSTGQTVFHLPRDRKLVNPAIADAPAVMVDMRMEFMMRVGALFGVPVAALFGKQQGSSLAMTNEGERNVAMSVFAEQQRRYKRLLIAVVSDLFIEAYAVQLAAWAVVETEKEEKVEAAAEETAAEPDPALAERTRKQLQTAVSQLTVALPGVPTTDEVLKLYGIGVLTWEAVVSYIGASQFIPDRYMNRAPQLELVQAAAVAGGAAPKETPAAPAAPKKRKK